MSDKFHEECAVMGVYGHPEAANMVYLGLYALQHRGQESCGIVSSDGKGLISHRQMGLVADAFKEDVIKRLEGQSAIGHNRYSTQGQSHLKNAQPFVVEYSQGPIAISHNGNLVNGTLLRDELEQAGSIFQSTIRHRSHHSSDRDFERADVDGTDRRSPEPLPRRLFAALS